MLFLLLPVECCHRSYRTQHLLRNSTRFRVRRHFRSRVLDDHLDPHSTPLIAMRSLRSQHTFMVRLKAKMVNGLSEMKTNANFHPANEGSHDRRPGCSFRLTHDESKDQTTDQPADQTDEIRLLVAESIPNFV